VASLSPSDVFKVSEARVWLGLATLCWLLWAPSAFAWLEISVKSDNAVIDVEPSGSAEVHHEILLHVRGGPFKGLRVVGVDTDAQPLAEAMLFNAASGRASGPGIPLIGMVENGDLQFTVEGSNRVGAGRYVLRFGYRTELLGRGLIDAQGEVATLRWVGPRFNDGIDSVRVVFRLPHGRQTPHVPDADPAGGQLGIVAEYDGVFLSDFRAANDKDELEVVRPHVAKGEPVVWRVRFDAAAVGIHSTTPTVTPQVASAPKAEPPRRLRAQLTDLWLVVLTGVCYGLLLFYKARGFKSAAAALGARARPLVPWAPMIRALFAAIALSMATFALLLSAWPLLALPPLIVAIALATELSPVAPSMRRGPGNWRSVAAAQAFSVRRGHKPAVVALDVGNPWGLVAFIVASSALLVLASNLFNTAAPRGVCLVTEALALCPLFFTGRAAQLPVPMVARARPLLQRLHRRLSRESQFQVTLLGRFPQSSDEPDELRLLVMPNKPLLGLNAIEVACELHTTFSGLQAAPLVLVRANEGSPTYEALSQGLVWSRGRTTGERACAVRPRVPTVGGTLTLLQQLREVLTRGQSVKSMERGVAPSSARASARVAAA